MRAVIWTLVIAAAGCHASASVENTMPVANLQSYATLGLRVGARSAWGPTLEADLGAHLRTQCGFAQIARVGPTPADVIVDLNITAMGRGGTGTFIRNPNLSTVDALLVLTDGHSGELLATSRIHGSSSGVALNTAGSGPEQEAVDAVAKAVADLLAKSGCAGPRVARVEPPPAPPPPPAGSDAPPPVDDAKRAQADALNQQGTEKLQVADSDGALAAFQQANAMAPDARYEFNACLALETLQRWNDAIAACKQAKTMNPQPRLATKIDQRLDVLAHKQ